jgi:hypothetical protein
VVFGEEDTRCAQQALDFVEQERKVKQVHRGDLQAGTRLMQLHREPKEVR